IDIDPVETAGDFAVTVDWGDGTPADDATHGIPPQALLVGGPAATPRTFDLFGAHDYLATGTFVVTATVTSKLTGAVTVSTSTATVTSPLLASGATLSAKAGLPIAGTPGGAIAVASLVDVDNVVIDQNTNFAA